MTLDVELAEIRDFLAGHAPFSDLPDDVLLGILPRLRVEYFRRGSAIMSPGRDNNHLYVIRSGAVDIRNEKGTLVDRGETGTCFGSTTLLGTNPSRFTVEAIEDVLTIVLDAATFHDLAGTHAEFHEFFDVQRSRRISAAIASQQTSRHGSTILKTASADLVRRPPVWVGTHASIREAAASMSENSVSALLVMDGERIAGIVTDRDLRNRVVAAGVDPARPVTDVMTTDPVTAPAGGLAFEVLLEMASRNIHHLPLVEDGRPIGVVTTTDLMRLERANPVYLAGDIAKQPDAAAVAAAAHRLPLVVENLGSQDASAEDMGRIITSIGDAIERRLIELATEQLGPAPVPYCWVTLGSRARMEQALAADQDNAIILDDTVQPEQLDYFAQLADYVYNGLLAAGYPPCRGKIMAVNSRLRAPIHQWRSTFRGWMQSPVPNAILRASIFFDMRPVAGETSLYAELAEQVRTEAPQSKRFLAHLAKNAVANEPPVGFFRGFVLAKEGEHKDTLDIKRGGIGAVVDVARVYALAIGSPEVHTSARIDAAIHAGIIDAAKGADLRDAFEFISYVRFRHQAMAVRAGRAPDNHLSPAELSSFDKRHLRVAFGIVRSAQSTLGAIHSTGSLG
ncbi:MAG: putative nucleotidyltransferase substrate binding domain-containing protein [Tetrasphaera sp.]